MNLPSALIKVPEKSTGRLIGINVSMIAVIRPVSDRETLIILGNENGQHERVVTTASANQVYAEIEKLQPSESRKADPFAFNVG